MAGGSQMPRELTDEEMAALESQHAPQGLSDEEMAQLEAKATPAPRPLKSPLESAISGTADMLTFGHSASIGAGLRAAAVAPFSEEDIGPLYDRYLNEQREHQSQAHEDNPWSYGAGNVVGAVVPMIAAGPLAGARAPLGAAGRGIAAGIKAITPSVERGLLSNLARGGAAGGIVAAGHSNARPTDSLEKAEEFGGDVAQGVGLGAATTGLFSGLGAGAKGLINKILPTPTKAAGLLGVSNEAAQEYVQNPGAINNASSTNDVIASFKKSVDDLYSQVIGGTQESRGRLTEEGGEFLGDEIADIARRHRQAIQSRGEGVLDESGQKAVAWLQNIEERYGTKAADPELAQSLSSASNGAVSEEQAADQLFRESQKRLSANRAKDLVMDTRAQVRGAQPHPDLAAPGSQVKNQFANELDEVIRGRSPEYARQMSSVAADEAMESEARALLRNPQNISKVFARAARNKDPAAEKLIADFDKRMGTNYMEKLRLANIKESFTRAPGGPGGSHRATVMGDIGEAVGSVLPNPLGITSKIGRAAGSMMSDSASRTGPATAKAMLDRAASINQWLNNNAVVQRLGPYAGILKTAASRGPAALVTTNQALLRDPEYRKLMAPEAAEEGP